MIIQGIEVMDQSVRSTGINPGDLYMARRNTGWHLLTCCYVKDNYIVNEENAYPYDTWECYKIKVK